MINRAVHRTLVAVHQGAIRPTTEGGVGAGGGGENDLPRREHFVGEAALAELAAVNAGQAAGHRAATAAGLGHRKQSILSAAHHPHGVVVALDVGVAAAIEEAHAPRAASTGGRRPEIIVRRIGEHRGVNRRIPVALFDNRTQFLHVGQPPVAETGEGPERRPSLQGQRPSIIVGHPSIVHASVSVPNPTFDTPFPGQAGFRVVGSAVRVIQHEISGGRGRRDRRVFSRPHSGSGPGQQQQRPGKDHAAKDGDIHEATPMARVQSPLRREPG